MKSKRKDSLQNYDRNINKETLRFLYGKSGNKCAFPGCNAPIFEEDGLLTGICCHIEAVSKGGPRYNPNKTNEEVNSENNLILLCGRHHTIVDANPKEYTVERLHEIKRNHERQYTENYRVLSEKMLFSLQQSMKEYWKEIIDIDNNDKIGHKIHFNTELSITDLMSLIDKTFSNIENQINYLAKSDNNIEEDLLHFLKINNIDSSIIESMPYYENPFMSRNWEIHNLGIPNTISCLKMYYLGFCVKIFSELTKFSSDYREPLSKYKELLKNYQKNNFYND